MSGPLPGYLAPLTAPASWLYAAAVAARNARFDRGRGVVPVTKPVISVGNITTGGTGKTPVVTWIVERLLAEGLRPVIAMRGYAARPGGPSDEALEYATRLPGVPVLANPDRVGALRVFLKGNPDVSCIVLDDGFQHRRLARDLDLVLIDATRGTMRDRLLPYGHLREPPAGLARADAVLVTRAPAVDPELSADIGRSHGRPPIAWSRHVWTGLEIHRADAPAELAPVTWLGGRRVAALLGVGNPRPVLDQIVEAGATVAAESPARDHERYDRRKMDTVRRGCRDADGLVMTGKDWVKARDLIDLAAWPVPIAVPRLEIDVFEGAGALQTLILEAVS